MRVLKYLLATIAMVAGAAVVAPPASAAQAYGAEFNMFFYGEDWPCNSYCVNPDYSWAQSNFTGIAGGPSWDDSFNGASVSISYTSVNCTADDWTVRIDSTFTSGGGSNPGVLGMSLHRTGTVFTGTATFISNSGVGSGSYSMTGTVTPDFNTDSVNACLGGPKALTGFGWNGVMVSASAQAGAPS